MRVFEGRFLSEKCDYITKCLTLVWVAIVLAVFLSLRWIFETPASRKTVGFVYVHELVFDSQKYIAAIACLVFLAAFLKLMRLIRGVITVAKYSRSSKQLPIQERALRHLAQDFF
jgi:hypothetical protein